jgi:hypothetical protein
MAVFQHCPSLIGFVLLPVQQVDHNCPASHEGLADQAKSLTFLVAVECLERQKSEAYHLPATHRTMHVLCSSGIQSLLTVLRSTSWRG